MGAGDHPVPLRDLTNHTAWDSISTLVDTSRRQLALWREDGEGGGMDTDESGDDLTELCGLLRVLADENRLRILKVLTQQETCVCDIMAQLELSQPLASHHLGVLKRAGPGPRPAGRPVGLLFPRSRAAGGVECPIPGSPGPGEPDTGSSLRLWPARVLDRGSENRETPGAVSLHGQLSPLADGRGHRQRPARRRVAGVQRRDRAGGPGSPHRPTGADEIGHRASGALQERARVPGRCPSTWW